MWHKVNKLHLSGLNKSQISRELGIDRGTVRRYLSMSEEEFLNSSVCNRIYNHKLDCYENFIVCHLRKYPYLSSSQIEDRLKEHYPDTFNVCSKTVYNFVSHIRKKYHIPKNDEESFRPYEKIPESPLGEYAQVDFGERYMETDSGSRIKVYFFAMVLCRSRYKYLYFSLTPFNTALSIYAHELAFNFYGGKPSRIIYDQDKVLLHRENIGDLVLTKGFRSFVNDQHFETVFCRKSDPESKGKIENVVKYVKNNFLKGRIFSNIENLNNESLSWLERTGNGSLHYGIHRIPSDAFKDEFPYLKPYNGIPRKPKSELKEYKVRKDNTISYRCCYYSVPTGIYSGSNTYVYVEEKDGMVIIYSKETGKVIAQHTVSIQKGKYIYNKSHRRDRFTGIDELEEKITEHIGKKNETMEYLRCIHSVKPRYYRDSLNHVIQHMSHYIPELLQQAISACNEMGVYSSVLLMETVESLRKKNGEKLLKEEYEYKEYAGNVNKDIAIPEKTDIKIFDSLF